MKFFHNLIDFFCYKNILRAPVLFTLSASSRISLCLTLIVFSFLGIFGTVESIIDGNLNPLFFTGFFQYTLGSFLILNFFIILPLMILATQITITAKAMIEPEIMSKTKFLDLLCVPYGAFCSYILLGLFEISFTADWPEQLTNNAVHTPLWTEAVPTFIAMAAIGIIGYSLLEFFDIKKLPPLLIVFGISAIYISVAMSILWMIQTYNGAYSLALILVPAVMAIISFRTIFCTVKILKQETDKKVYNNPILQWLNLMLKKSELLPLYALIGAIPLLSVIIAILCLFGQQPDYAIKVFTETSEWNLSAKVSPQNVYEDMHYLCTVAAGGHKKVVKPKRYGIRHGHRVTVNRQLCVANAFEQVLEEKTPRFHKAVRGFYDKYGFPISKLIKTKLAADTVYILMKPLEWVFLFVLYMTDKNPENRIAIQYTGKTLKDFDI